VDLEALAREAEWKLAAQPKGAAKSKNADCCANDAAPPRFAASCHAQGNSQPRSIVALEALRCRGNSTLWVTSGAVTSPPPLFKHQVRLLLLAERIALVDLHSSSPAFVPDDPPPRCG
jgi:hypothetical protein